MQKTSDAAELAAIAKRMRGTAIQMITEAGSGHPGGSLSAADIVAAVFRRDAA
jgi:transketolase